MNRMFTVVLAAAALLASTETGVQASAAKAKPDQQCFRGERMANWASDGDKVVYVRLETAAVYQVTLANACPGLGEHRTLAFEADVGDQIRDGKYATLITRSGAGPLRRPIHSVRKLSRDETAALPNALRP